MSTRRLIGIGEPLRLPDGIWKIIEFCDEPDTGACVLEAIDPSRSKRIFAPYKWIEAMTVDPVVERCTRCGSEDCIKLCESCGEER